MIKLILTQLTPSNNKLLRMHYRKRKRLKESYMWELLAVMNENNITSDVVAGDRRRLTIISYRKKLLDQDNFIGGLKLLIDSLVDVHLLYDDSLEYLDLQEPGQRIDLKNPRTEVYISEG